nr:MAG TPA: hypothetical protein [Caudoviricetes sp.]
MPCPAVNGPSSLRPLMFGWKLKRRSRRKLNENSAGAATIKAPASILQERW